MSEFRSTPAPDTLASGRRSRVRASCPMRRIPDRRRASLKTWPADGHDVEIGRIINGDVDLNLRIPEVHLMVASIAPRVIAKLTLSLPPS